MKINKNSWHYRAVAYTSTYEDFINMNLCGYLIGLIRFPIAVMLMVPFNIFCYFWDNYLVNIEFKNKICPKLEFVDEQRP